MKILLLGEYSGVHWTLAQGLRTLGHDVTVASNGDFWKSYRCDISMVRKSTGLTDTIQYVAKLVSQLPRMRGYDVVQIINPLFLELKAEHIAPIYRYLRRRNGKMFLAAYGMDWYYIKTCLESDIFRYSELKVDGRFRDISDNRSAVQDWINGAKGPLNRMIADDCDGIACGLWEYYESYCRLFPDKTRYIPFPIKAELPAERYVEGIDDRVRIFIGIQKSRSEFKGTDIILKVLDRLQNAYPDKCTVVKVHNVPFAEYRKLMRSCDILVDQLYSPSPNMNSLLAMSQGLAVAGGGEEEPYILMGEEKLRPVINLPCHEKDIYSSLEKIILDHTDLQKRKKQGIEFVNKYHLPEKVAAQYEDFWQRAERITSLPYTHRM